MCSTPPLTDCELLMKLSLQFTWRVKRQVRKRSRHNRVCQLMSAKVQRLTTNFLIVGHVDIKMWLFSTEKAS